MLFVNIKVSVFSRVEFYLASLSTTFEEVQYNIVMTGSKVEEIFFLFMPSLSNLHTRSLLGHGFASFVTEKSYVQLKLDWIRVMLQLYVYILHGSID